MQQIFVGTGFRAALPRRIKRCGPPDIRLCILGQSLGLFTYPVQDLIVDQGLPRPGKLGGRDALFQLLACLPEAVFQALARIPGQGA